jgi:hypothetical protein
VFGRGDLYVLTMLDGYGLSHLDAHVRLENELNSEGSVVVIEDTFRIWWWPRSIVWSAVRGMQLRA